VSSDNVDILRRGLEAFNRDGVEGLIEILDPEFEGHTDPELTIEPGVYVGHAGIRRWFAGFEGFIDDVRFEPDEFIPAGDRVLVPGRLVGRGRDSGIEAAQRLFQVWTLRDGKVVRLESYTDMASARAAAGM
jgi:ketosteroid isomerase-like protein